jgi:signal transduction histidine kinase
MHAVVDKYGFQRISLPRQFALVTAAILVVCMAIFGTWVGHQIERNAMNRAAATTALYVEGILAAQLHAWADGRTLTPTLRETLDSIFIAGPLHANVASFKLWDTHGRLIYSTDPTQEGRHYQISKHLAAALAGEVQTEVTDLSADDELIERRLGSHLLEVYVPVRGSTGSVIAVAEFYHPMETIENEIRNSQRQSWALVVGGAAAIFLFLYGLMQRANSTIVEQQRGLRDQLAALRSTLKENEQMRDRISAAGAHTTALNEQLLRRLAADLHDGPAQDLAFALMRFDELPRPADAPGDMLAIQQALRSSLDELRAICAGLGVPGIAELSTADTLRRAVRDVERRMNLPVAVDIDDTLDAAPLAVKITAYRLIQESLTNCWRHARHEGIAVKACCTPAGDRLCIEVSDRGPGFDATAVAATGRLGLAFMRERVRLLGGHFEVITAPGQGTTIRAWMPLAGEAPPHD